MSLHPAFALAVPAVLIVGTLIVTIVLGPDRAPPTVRQTAIAKRLLLAVMLCGLLVSSAQSLLPRAGDASYGIAVAGVAACGLILIALSRAREDGVTKPEPASR